MLIGGEKHQCWWDVPSIPEILFKFQWKSSASLGIRCDLQWKSLFFKGFEMHVSCWDVIAKFLGIVADKLRWVVDLPQDLESNRSIKRKWVYMVYQQIFVDRLQMFAASWDECHKPVDFGAFVPFFGCCPHFASCLNIFPTGIGGL